MDANILKCMAFIKTVEYGSFTKSAEVLHKIVKVKLGVPAYRDIAFALRSRKNASLAVMRFMEYLDFRHADGN